MTTTTYLAWLLAIAFTWAAALNLRGPGFIRAEFAAWGYPAWLRPAVGVAELAAAVLLLVAPARAIGAGIGALVLIGVLFTLGRDRAWMRCEYPLFLLALCAWLVMHPG